jgi:predicted RNA binding protein YcfA (HicA-like mRNA interferase family)
MERDSRRIIARLLREGFEVVSTRGSHHKLRRGDRIVVIPHPKKDLPIGTVRSIARMAGWKEEP